MLVSIGLTVSMRCYHAYLQCVTAHPADDGICIGVVFEKRQ